MKILINVLRILGVLFGVFIGLVGVVGFSTGEYRGLAVALVVLGVSAVILCLYRSSSEREEARIKKETKAAGRVAAAEKKRTEAAQRARLASEERQRQEELRRIQNQESAHTRTAVRFNNAVCPRCGSTAVTGAKRGYKVASAAFWAVLLGVGGYWLFYDCWDRIVVSIYNVFGEEVYHYLRPVSRYAAAVSFATIGVLTGLRIGGSGSQKVTVTCLNCGCRYDPALRHLYEEVFAGRKTSAAANDAEPQQAPPRSDRYDPPIPTGFAEYLRETGQEDPCYSGRNNALECVLIDMADDKERAVMWAYAVDCARRGRTMGNILQAPDYHKYRAFGEYASRHGDVLASIAARRAWEYWEPTKTTKAYKAAAEFLS